MTTSRIWTRGVRPVSGMLVTAAASPFQCADGETDGDTGRVTDGGRDADGVRCESPASLRGRRCRVRPSDERATPSARFHARSPVPVNFRANFRAYFPAVLPAASAPVVTAVLPAAPPVDSPTHPAPWPTPLTAASLP
ncbi:hypothetical protein GCM10020256_51740 [Streptomyces thermocoprophilus]